ncbi:uncharacterized protein JN550_003911 [Neoarthrinium moseri]|uniref:uncharacterized protein n=1 Tax=Neoarthrinium moseri TaxID=1658444 RepID=UPI001FDB9122|nr:uncharacterized protein JN550_003911 [Neoarthrinium moseri]KAI1872192.1 hypothetical protein JN550_003911 [Neoarthrinium moseri]
MAAATEAADGSPSAAPAMAVQNDPFVTSDASPVEREPRHRYSTFDSHLFTLGPNASPAQAKRALEAHLAETDRRMEEAGKLGTALVQQRKELTQRLQEVESLQAESELSSDLKEKLVEIEKDYNDVARESARAFLPKPRVPSNEAAAGSPFVPEGKGGRRSVSPSKFEAQATGSPTKLSVPNRKLRNQPANRIHDIEFAAEISQSLIVQVRNLQALLAEREEELRDIKIEKSKLEYDAEGFQQRVKTLDESQNRYKDENWSLETQVHELLAAQREAADREKKLQQSVSILQAEKNTAQRDLDEVKLSHAKLSEEHAAAVKHHDTELGAAKRNMVMADSERAAMQRKIEELTGQNQELAKAVSSQRGRTFDRQEIQGTSDEDFATANDDNTPEHSPPPSPIKGTPRHSLLESETLKTSLQHAQRTIQSLRNNVHREKTEKLELRRMLQDARDEIEKARNDPMPGHNKRGSKTSSREFKKPPRLLGGLRSARSEIFAADDPDWEDHPASSSPAQTVVGHRPSGSFAPVLESVENEQFDTANETSDQAFETANERGTETDDFHTGAEEFSSDEDAQTETDSPTKRLTLRGKPPNLPMGLTRSGSVRSTASTEDEYDYEDRRTPTSQLPPLQSRFPLRVSRGANRRSRQASEDPTFQSSPGSFAHSAGGTPQGVQSLAAELGDFDGSDNESNMSATPSRRSIRSRTGSIRGTTASPPPPVPQLPRPAMVDSGMMTEPVQDFSSISMLAVPGAERPVSMATVASGVSEYSDAGTLNMEENLAKFPSPPTSPPNRDLSLSNVHAHDHAEQNNKHAEELEALKQDHAKHVETLHHEKAAAQAAALAALELQHASELSRATEDAQAAHARQLETLYASHADDKTKAVANAAASHTSELKAIQDAHAEKLAQMESEHKAALDSGLEALKASHAQQLQSSKKASDAAHAAELASLVTAHTAQIQLAKKELNESHVKELESLKASHAAQIEQAKQASDASHAKDLDSIKATHLEQIDEVKKALADTHNRELEALSASHATQADQVKKDSEAAHAAAIAALIASHSEKLSASTAEADVALKERLEALKLTHRDQLEASRTEAEARLAKELDALRLTHSNQLESSKADSDKKFAAELEELKAAHGKALDVSRADGDAMLAKELEALRASHAEQLSNQKDEILANMAQEIASIKSDHTQQLDKLKRENDAAHAAELAALAALHAKQLASSKTESDVHLSKQLASLKDSHAQELETLRTEHAAAHAKELESFKSALGKQLESSKSEGDAAHSEQIEALKAANAEIIEAHKRDSAKTLEQALESAKGNHERQIEALKSDHSAARSKDSDELAAKHATEIAALGVTLAAAKAKEIDAMVAKHDQHISTLQSEHESVKAKELGHMSSTYEKQIETLKAEAAAAKLAELEQLTSTHQTQIDALKAESLASKEKELQDLKDKHKNEIDALNAESSSLRSQGLDDLSATHAAALMSLKSEHENAIAKLTEELQNAHTLKLADLRTEHESAKATDLDALKSKHGKDLESLRAEHETSRAQELENLKSEHAVLLATLRSEHQATLDNAVQNLKASHAKDLDSLDSSHSSSLEAALAAIKSGHAKELDDLRLANDAALSKALDVATAEHAKSLDAYRAESSAEREKLLASHVMELEALRKALTVTRPTLGFSSMKSVATEPIEEPELLRSPKREGFIIPREEQPHTPLSSDVGAFGKRSRDTAVPFIAEDDTRQSPSAAAGPETPESQRPFREISTNTDARSTRKQATPTADQSSQTTLTSDGIDQLLTKPSRRYSRDSLKIAVPFDDGTPATVRHRRSQEIIGSPSKLKGNPSDSGVLSAPGPVPSRRPGSSSSVRSSQQTMPPLPPNHREAIEAARGGSSHGAKGAMGPPLLPASAYKNPAARPWTPRDRPQSPLYAHGTTPRAIRTNSSQGYGDVHSPTRLTARSRQSSVTSFASEIDTRFNMPGEMGMGASGFVGPNTDPRMIQAITQTMIGEYLWKYTRKPGRGEMSGNRHRRYFWVHPYTRTLYWSNRDPSTAGRSELKAKSVPIEAVRVVADDNPMPPGLHRKSLVIISPGRTVKFTCTTGQRHETWFNALSYLLLRTGNEGQTDAEEMAGNITQEDVDEFNPSIGQRPTIGNRPPPSLSSYNSRTTRVESPNVDMSIGIPTLTPTHERTSVRPGTLTRLSGYLSRTSTSGSLFNSLRTRSHGGHGHDSAIYEASEVNDSAEELRQIIEQQDREADRLENVRACCDGKHDVGTLSHSTKRSRSALGHSHSHTHHPTTTTPLGTVRSRG